MKYLITLLFTISLYGTILDFTTVTTDFTQTVTNEQGKTIQYSGKLYLTKEGKTKWQYITPIEKSVFIRKNRVTIVEPEILQVTIIESGEELDIIKLYKESKKKNNKRIAVINKREVEINENNNFITEIKYKDEIDNQVTIKLTNVIKNKKFSKEVFTPKISTEYDYIYR